MSAMTHLGGPSKPLSVEMAMPILRSTRCGRPASITSFSPAGSSAPSPTPVLQSACWARPSRPARRRASRRRSVRRMRERSGRSSRRTAPSYEKPPRVGAIRPRTPASVPHRSMAAARTPVHCGIGRSRVRPGSRCPRRAARVRARTVRRSGDVADDRARAGGLPRPLAPAWSGHGEHGRSVAVTGRRMGPFSSRGYACAAPARGRD